MLLTSVTMDGGARLLDARMRRVNEEEGYTLTPNRHTTRRYRMPYSARMQKSHLYSVYFAPRGNERMADLGMQIAQQYLSPFDKIIGLVGVAGSGKSMIIKGMFPGLELTNDDEGVNVRPLPL